MNYQQFVTSRVKWLDSIPADLIHATIGILGELIEYENLLNKENAIEELGDIEFYTEHLEQVLSRITFQVGDTDITRAESLDYERNPLKHARYYSAELLDFAKKAWVYNKALEKLPFHDAFIRFKICLHYLTEDEGTTREHTQTENRVKLEKRYPTGYTDQAAQQRADKT